MKLSKIIDALLCGVILVLIWHLLTPGEITLNVLLMKAVASMAVIVVFVKFSLVRLPEALIALVKRIRCLIATGTKKFFSWAIGADVGWLMNTVATSERMKVQVKVYWRRLAVAVCSAAVLFVTVSTYLYHFRLILALCALIAVMAYLTVVGAFALDIGLENEKSLDHATVVAMLVVWFVQGVILVLQLGDAVFEKVFGSPESTKMLYLMRDRGPEWYQLKYTLAFDDCSLELAPAHILMIVAGLVTLLYVARTCMTLSEFAELAHASVMQKKLEEIDCPVCQGTGEIDGRPCRRCNGNGILAVDRSKECKFCNGTGIFNNGACPYCFGSGFDTMSYCGERDDLPPDGRG